MHGCMHAYKRTCPQTHIHMHSHVPIYARTRDMLQIHTYKPMYVYTYVHASMYVGEGVPIQKLEVPVRDAGLYIGPSGIL